MPANGKIVLQRQTVHADAVLGLPLPGLCRMAEPVRSTRLQTSLILNTTQLPPFVMLTITDGFCTKSLLTKHLHAEFVVVRRFSHW